ncbi:hypothetical protein EX895_005615 [Sporisorium graminicola]|uniref:Uncharacterized protein n=1 Tax=Sporisorium graminicola TaxID=280036 RepID=A0A4U7KMX4_9BASI|nr:hypothetical protein EX895_005615 [Sporisorium graminicola]TKY85453.1 hypothetical protein EX895_005615 [Sporisorium graminicola]
MVPPKKANVDNSTTIRAASRNKQRSLPSNRSTDGLFGSSSGTSLASSLSSLFSPQPHGKDAALASLLASSSKSPVKLGQASSGLAAYGSFTNSQSQPSGISTPRSLDDKLKDKRKGVATKVDISDSTPSTSKATKDETTFSSSKQVAEDASTPRDRVQKQTTKSASSSTSTPVVPNVPVGRKPVFRPVLASSTAVSWPEMPIAGSKTILHALIELLAQPDIQAILHRDLGRRSRLRSAKCAEASPAADEDNIDGAASNPDRLAPQQVLAGINSITRAIEADIARDLEELQAQDVKQKAKEAQHAGSPSVKVVFVCRHDVPQPMLVAHLPMLVSARNAVLHASDSEPTSDLTQRVLLFALPIGSESLLAKALKIRRASVIALTTAFTSARLAHILAAIQRETGSVCQLRASWLETAIRSATQSPHYPHWLPPLAQQPTSIKLLRTTQPVDLNACKAAKRTKRKQRAASWRKHKMATLQRVKDLQAQLKASRKRTATGTEFTAATTFSHV